jgi:Methyltransferase domain
MSWRRRDFLTRMFLVGAAGLTLASVGVYWRVANPSQRSQSSDAFKTPYDSRFFAALSAGSASSAAQILPEVVRLIAPKSAVELGSGTGEWLGELRKLGVTDVMGVDGGWVDPAALKIPIDQFTPFDLRNKFVMDRTFDLAISVETAEHLPPERGEGFVADLVALAPVVLFSAAIPGQDGTDHINERWQDYWAGLFAKHQYIALDCLRLKFWNDPRIEWWYRQNIILYVRRDRVEADPRLHFLASLQPPEVIRFRRQ